MHWPVEIIKPYILNYRPQDSLLETIYFWFSLFCLLSRTLMVSLSAARVHDEAQKPANIIRAIPIDSYESEVSFNQYLGGISFLSKSSLVFLINQANRFLEQVVNTKVGFTGMRFFYFTRPLILSVVGTIITYELVLIQFQVLTPKTKENLCRFIDVNDWNKPIGEKIKFVLMQLQKKNFCGDFFSKLIFKFMGWRRCPVTISPPFLQKSKIRDSTLWSNAGKTAIIVENVSPSSDHRIFTVFLYAWRHIDHGKYWRCFVFGQSIAQ